MKLMKRNLKPFWASLNTTLVNVTLPDGTAGTEKRIKRTNIKKFYGNIRVREGGKVVNFTFGEVPRYDLEIECDNLNTGITEKSVVWLSQPTMNGDEPSTPWEYEVKRIRPTLNSVTFNLQRVSGDA